MNQNDIEHNKKESKTVSPSSIQDTLEKDHNVHIVGLTQSKYVVDESIDVYINI